MADIPGLIEGAHAGAGLGHEFLRHIERAGILVHLVEPMPDGRQRSDGELRHDSRRARCSTMHDLGERPEIVAVTKAELPGAAEVQARLAETTGGEVLLISAVTGQGLNQLVHRVAAVLETQQQAGDMNAARLIAVDIGNSSTKLGWFADCCCRNQPAAAGDGFATFPRGSIPPAELAERFADRAVPVASRQRPSRRRANGGEWVAAHRPRRRLSRADVSRLADCCERRFSRARRPGSAGRCGGGRMCSASRAGRRLWSARARRSPSIWSAATARSREASSWPAFRCRPRRCLARPTCCRWRACAEGRAAARAGQEHRSCHPQRPVLGRGRRGPRDRQRGCRLGSIRRPQVFVTGGDLTRSLRRWSASGRGMCRTWCCPASPSPCRGQ